MAYLLKAFCYCRMDAMSFLWLGTILKDGLFAWLQMRSSIPCSSSRRRAARSTYSRDQILSRTFWGTVDCHFTLLVQWPKSSVIGPKSSVTGPKALLLAPKALLQAPKGLLVTCMLCRWLPVLSIIIWCYL